MSLVIANIVIPITLDDRFIAPDLEKALEYYPSFRRMIGLDWPIQAYLSAIMKQIDEAQPNGYDGNSAISEFINYVGWRRFAELIGKPMDDEQWKAFVGDER